MNLNSLPRIRSLVLESRRRKQDAQCWMANYYQSEFRLGQPDHANLVRAIENTREALSSSRRAHDLAALERRHLRASFLNGELSPADYVEGAGRIDRVIRGEYDAK